MKQMELLFSSEVTLEDSRRMKLDYSLMEIESEEDQATPYYGIHISKYLGDTVEADEIQGISYSKDKVVSMIRKLFQYEVTPISMVEIVDEMVTVGG